MVHSTNGAARHWAAIFRIVFIVVGARPSIGKPPVDECSCYDLNWHVPPFSAAMGRLPSSYEVRDAHGQRIAWIQVVESEFVSRTPEF
jgi:hypothetical protein